MAAELPKTWDAESVLSMRHATELQELVTKMEDWNDDRGGGAEVNTFSVISLRGNVFSPDPEDIKIVVTHNAQETGSKPSCHLLLQTHCIQI